MSGRALPPIQRFLQNEGDRPTGRPLSPPMQRFLRALVAGTNPREGMDEQANRGSYNTSMGLWRRGLVDVHDVPTEAGRAWVRDNPEAPADTEEGPKEVP